MRAGRLFADGSFVIGHEGSHELHFYSREGVLEHRVGREGSGPHEFRSLDFVEVLADSVWVYDRVNQRISVLHRTAEFVRLIPLAALSEGFPQAVGVFGDGSIVVTRSEPGTIESGLHESDRRHFVLHSDGSTVDLGRFFRGESYRASVGEDWADVGRPFAREGLTAVRGDEWFYSGGAEYRVEQYDVEQYDMDGRLRRVYSYPGRPPPVTPRELEEYLSGIRAAAGGPSLREQLMRRAPLPERMPAYAQLVIDRDGTVWAALHPGAQPPRCWHVYERRPARFAKVCLPEGFTVLDVAGGSVLGVLRDEDNVERIAKYRLVK